VSFWVHNLDSNSPICSNTKTALFLNYANAFEPLRQVISSAPKPNAITSLEDIDQNRGCRLDYAADMLLMLTKGLLRHPQIDVQFGNLAQADYKNPPSTWSVRSRSEGTLNGRLGQSRSLVLCTGSSPMSMTLPTSSPIAINLDIALDRQKLRSSLSTAEDIVVGVIGTSHSAIVALMNCYELATETYPRLRIKWFVRSPLSYAVEMDGWILRDNTGLKGASADFAREHLEDSKLPRSRVGRYVTKVDCPDAGDESMRPQLSACTHVVQAIGFKRESLPHLSIDGADLQEVTYDPESGSLQNGRGYAVPHLYGAGIAFPERVTDPAGNTEHAVGMWKFVKYLQRVVPSWR